MNAWSINDKETLKNKGAFTKLKQNKAKENKESSFKTEKNKCELGFRGRSIWISEQ